MEDNTQASMALQIAAESPSSRHDMEVTINNASTGNPTQITVFADGDGSTIHDVAPNVFGEVLGAISTVVSVSALVTGNAYLYYAAAALDAANAGEDFSNGQDVSAVLATAAAISAGITGGAGGTPGTTPPPVSAQIINAAVQGVGGVYGVVQSAEAGNGLGIVAGALEAAAAAASGIGMYEGGQTQAMLNSVATALGTIGLATSVGSAFASGNIALGLEDSLNLFLPALAEDYQQTQATITQGISAANISPTADMLGIPQHIAFVGGFFDSTLNSLTGNAPMASAYKEFKAAYPNVDAQYFTWTDTSGIANWANQNGGQVTIIAHSYGADTAASIVASGVKVQTLVTLDPVSYVRPNFRKWLPTRGNG